MKKIIISISLLILWSVSFGQLPNTLSAADKIYGLSKFWQEVNYNFIYLNKVDRKAWDSTYKAMITSVTKTANDYEYYRELQKFCAMLKDGHTNIYMPQVIQEKSMTTMFGDYRFFIQNIDNKAIIVRTNASKKDEVPAGSEVIEVNGKPTDQYIAVNVAPYIASSTDYVLKDWSYSGLLQGLEGDRFLIKIKKPKGEIISLDLVHKRTTEEAVYPAFEAEKELMDFKWYDNNRIAYVSLNSFGDPKIDTLFWKKLPELYTAKAMIIDLRFNGGGSTTVGTEILKYLTADTVLYGSKNRSRLHIPSFKAWGKFAEPKDTAYDAWAKKSLLNYLDLSYYDFDYSPKQNRLKEKRIVIPTVILLGHNTASAAEDFLIYADNQKHMIKMGENSFGSTGQPFMFDMPGGGSARICTKQDTYPDGREFVGYGIKPDIEVKRTLRDYLDKKDPVMDRALKYLEEKLKAK
ncbi:MAG: peptidase S41 [Citrobacter freundii]|nr:MAG: peptidase S41 [Citrobacter freundii]